MGQFVLKYDKGEGRTQDVEIPVRVSRTEKKKIEGLPIVEVVLDGKVFKPDEQNGRVGKK